MASYTTNINLKKPAENEAYNIEDFNENFDKIDTEILKKLDKEAKASENEAEAGVNDAKYMTALKTKICFNSLFENLKEDINNIYLKNSIENIDAKDLNELREKITLGYGKNLINAPNEAGYLVSLANKQIFLDDNDIYIRTITESSTKWEKITNKEKAYITLANDANQFVNTTDETVVEFNKEFSNFGDKFVIENNSIKVIDNVKRLKAYANIWVEQSSSGYAWITIVRKRGDTETVIANAITDNSGTFKTLIPISIIQDDIKINDLIFCKIKFSNANENNKIAGGSYSSNVVTLTVEEM